MKTSYACSLTVVILLLTVQLSFSRSIWLNLWVILAALVFLCWRHHYGGLLAVFWLPLLPALATYWSVSIQGQAEDAPLLALRTVTFAALGIVFALGVELEELLLVLEQKGLPANFVYGLLVVVHGLPAIRQEVADLREAALYKGRRLFFWSPLLYFKTIVTAFEWQKNYTEAMYAHGYTENQPRSHFLIYRESRKAASILAIFMFTCQALLFL